jgi:hypothetical protein
MRDDRLRNVRDEEDDSSEKTRILISVMDRAPKCRAPSRHDDLEASTQRSGL